MDLDGTLIKSDLLFESFLLLVRRNPWNAVLALGWLLRGRAYLKRQIASRVELDACALPYNEALLEYLREESAAGRELVLVTASDARLANAVAAHTAIFSSVMASDGETNLKGQNKRLALEARYGVGGFDYAGDAAADLPVWSAARRALVVEASSGIARRAAAVATVERTFPHRRGILKPLLRAIRVHQWVKNALIFVPVITSHQMFHWASDARAIVAFAAYSLCASSVYVLNDLLDLRADRLHPSKRRRPFAAGDLPIAFGAVLIPVLLAGAAGLSLLLPWDFRFVLAGYYALTLAYTLDLKQRMLLDVFALGFLYTMRVLAGGAATGIVLSPWLLAFSMFFFLSLALVKRFSELRALPEGAAAPGRGYFGADLQAIGSLGASSGFMCVLVLALYINSAQVVELYRAPAVLWSLCLLFLYWISRLWVLCYRGCVDVDPIVFALRDRASYVIAAASAAILFIAARGVF